MDICSHALRWLGPRASLGRHPAHFAAAYQDGQCPLCHSPMQEVLPGHPCPHWLIRSGRVAGQVSMPFARYGIEGVLYFLLLCVDIEQARSRTRGAAWFSADADNRYLHVRLKQRKWCFQMARAQGAAGAVRVHFVNVRSRATCSYDVDAADGDLALLRAVAQWELDWTAIDPRAAAGAAGQACMKKRIISSLASGPISSV